MASAALLLLTSHFHTCVDVQIHYNNVQRDPGLVDSSGFRVRCEGSRTRKGAGADQQAGLVREQCWLGGKR